MGAQSKRGPASAPAQPVHELPLKLRIEGVLIGCLGCTSICDLLAENAERGDLEEVAECVKDIAYHVKHEHRRSV